MIDFIPHETEYFTYEELPEDLNRKLHNKEEIEFDYKILEWLSRPACKGTNRYWQKYILRGINSYFKQTWSKDEMMDIYTYIGNHVNRTKCIEFFKSGFNFKILRKDRS